MRGGEFATAARSGHENVQYAQTFLKRGMSYQAAAKAAGVNELTLREMFPQHQPKARVVVLPPRPVKRESLRFVPLTALDESEAIIAEVVAPFGLTVAQVRGKAQYRQLAWPRQAAMAEVYKRRPHLSLPQIGRLFNRDHTTVLHGIKAHEARMAWVEFLQWAAKPDEQPDLFARAA